MSAYSLYVAGDSEPSRRALANLPGLLERFALDAGEIEVVDIRATPDRAETDSILATPTLIRWEPEQRRIVGDLSDPARVQFALGITPHTKEAPVSDHSSNP